MAIFVIGDIHGCYKALKSVFRAAPIEQGDTVVFLGDYVSRGPDSAKVLNWLIKKQGVYNIILLRGNHEVMMLRARNGKKQLREWIQFGGKTVLKSYGIEKNKDWAKNILKEHWDLLESTQKYVHLKHFVFVHAGLTPGVPLEEQKNRVLFWLKNKNPKPYASGIVTVCGHTPQKSGKIAHLPHWICVDTYAYGGGWLSCLNVETGEYWQANQKGQLRNGVVPA